MNSLEPSQLFEMILSQQNHFSQYEMPLSVRKFNKMIDELADFNVSVRFGYSDFIDYIESFYESVPFKHHTLYIAYSEDLHREVRNYNRIHENIERLIKTKDLWQDYLK